MEADPSTTSRPRDSERPTTDGPGGPPDRPDVEPARSEPAGPEGRTEPAGQAAAPPEAPSVVPVPDVAATPRAISIPLMILTALAIVYTLYLARSLMLPVFIAVVLGLLLRPPVRHLRRRGIPAAISAALILATLLTVATLGLVQLSGPATAWLRSAPETFPQVEDRLRSLIQPMAGLGEASRRVEELADGDDEADRDAIPVRIRRPRLTTILLETTRTVAVGAVLAVVLLYFLLALGDRLLENVVSIVPTWRGKRNTVELVRDVESGISRYLITVTTINACLGTAIGTALWLIGLPNPVLWGVMAAFLNFIPYLGAAVGSTVVFLVALITFDTAWPVVLAPLAYFSINALEGNFITPMIVGRSMSLNPLLIFASLAFWGWLWGIGGALLAVPMLAITKIICDHFPRLEPIAVLLRK